MTTVMRIFYSDRDPHYVALIAKEFSNQPSVSLELFQNSKDCVKALGKNPDIIILHCGGSGSEPTSNAVENFAEIKKQHPLMFIVILSDEDTLETAQLSLQYAACENIVRSETTFLRLHKIIRNLSEQQKTERALAWYMTKF